MLQQDVAIGGPRCENYSDVDQGGDVDVSWPKLVSADPWRSCRPLVSCAASVSSERGTD